MSSASVVLFPAAVSVGLFLRGPRHRAGLTLVFVALFAAIASVAGLLARPDVAVAEGFRLDATSALFLSLVNVIFLGIAVYVWSMPPPREGVGRFEVLALAFLTAVNVVLTANHFLIQWIALEASTLAAAPLIVRPGKAATRHACWHYLLFSAIGLALVPLGFTCIGIGLADAGQSTSLFIDRLPVIGPSGPWSQLGVGLVLLGLGTKLGLAPMYFWLPEVYDEAPPAVTALLGAVQFNAALMMLVRVVQVFGPAHANLVSLELVTMGILSMSIATANILVTRNIKRLLAYASINHAGVIAIGLGIGKTAAYGVLLYALSNAFIKAILFLTAGRIKQYYRTKDTRLISGLIIDRPYSGVFLMVGTFALLGFPPFGSFVGELLILSAVVGTGHSLVFFTFCVLITMTFVATGRTIFPMIWGTPRTRHDWPRETVRSVWVKILLLIALIVLGTYIPERIERVIHEVAVTLERT